MNLVVDVGVLVWIFVNLLVMVLLARRNASFGVLVNLCLLTYLLLYVVPIYFERSITDDLFLSVLFANFSFLFVFVFSSLFFGGDMDIGVSCSARKIRFSNVSVFCAVVFCSLGNVATYISLINSGGLFAVISDFGGRGYLSVRVNSEGGGILGVLAWLSPFSLSFLFAVALIKRKVIFWVLFSLFFSFTAIGYGLLTVRHNMVATLMMLMLTYLALRKVSFLVVFSIGLVSLTVMIFFQSFRVSGVDGFALENALDSTLASNEHIQVTEFVISETDLEGFLYFSHISDIGIFIVPRALWPSKPMTSSLNRAFFPDVADVGSEKAVGLVAEGYASLGLLGVCVISLLFAVFVALLQVLLNRVSVRPDAAFIAIALVPICYIGVRTGFFGKHLISFILIFLQYLVLFKQRWVKFLI